MKNLKKQNKKKTGYKTKECVILIIHSHRMMAKKY